MGREQAVCDHYRFIDSISKLRLFRSSDDRLTYPPSAALDLDHQTSLTFHRKEIGSPLADTRNIADSEPLRLKNLLDKLLELKSWPEYLFRSGIRKLEVLHGNRLSAKATETQRLL